MRTESYPRRLRAMRRSTDVRECVGLEIQTQYVCALLLVLGLRREPGAKGQGMRIPTGKKSGESVAWLRLVRRAIT